MAMRRAGSAVVVLLLLPPAAKRARRELRELKIIEIMFHRHQKFHFSNRGEGVCSQVSGTEYAGCRMPYGICRMAAFSYLLLGPNF
jgi:hypothetical protein